MFYLTLTVYVKTRDLIFLIEGTCKNKVKMYGLRYKIQEAVLHGFQRCCVVDTE